MKKLVEWTLYEWIVWLASAKNRNDRTNQARESNKNWINLVMELGRFSIFIRIADSCLQIYLLMWWKNWKLMSNALQLLKNWSRKFFRVRRSQHAIMSRCWLHKKHTKSSNDSLGTGNWHRHPLENLKTTRKFLLFLFVLYRAFSRSLIRFKMEEWVWSKNKSLSIHPHKI